MPLKVSTAQFVDAWHRHGSPSAVAAARVAKPARIRRKGMIISPMGRPTMGEQWRRGKLCPGDVRNPT